VIDALIVGGGPAGAAAALQLARRGYLVSILERSRFPRTKVCGEYLSPGACSGLTDLGLMPAVAREAHVLRSIALGGFDVEPVTLRLPANGAASISRSKLDSIMLAAACGAGAQLIGGSFLDASETRTGIEVRYRDRDGREAEIRARVLVGADGAWSAVAQRRGMARAQRRGGRWAVGGHLRERGDGDTLEMYVGQDGYYARNPLGDDGVNAMLVLGSPTLGDDAERAALSISAGRRGFGSATLEKRVSVGPLRYAPQAIANRRVLLTGDAAGLLDPFVGQGVAVAIESSATVADAVKTIVDGGSMSSAAARFSAARRAAVLPRSMLAGAVNAIIRNRFLRARAARAIERDRGPAETLLAAVAGAAPVRSVLTPRTLAGLLA